MYFSPFWLHCSDEWMLMFKGVEVNYEIKAKAHAFWNVDVEDISTDRCDLENKEYGTLKVNTMGQLDIWHLGSIRA